MEGFRRGAGGPYVKKRKIMENYLSNSDNLMSFLYFIDMNEMIGIGLCLRKLTGRFSATIMSE